MTGTITLADAVNASPVAFTPDGTRAYVTDLGPREDPNDKGGLFVIDTATGAVIATLPNDLGYAYDVAVGPW